VVNCDAGFYAAGSPSQCTACYGPPCSTCDGPGPTSCLTCSGSNTEIDSGVCSCKPSYINTVASPDVDCACPPNSTAIGDICTCDDEFLDTDSSPVTNCEACPSDC